MPGERTWPDVALARFVAVPMRPKPWTAHGTAAIDGAERVSAEAEPIARARITAENLAILMIERLRWPEKGGEEGARGGVSSETMRRGP